MAVTLGPTALTRGRVPPCSAGVRVFYLGFFALYLIHPRNSAYHAAIATPLTEAEVHVLCLHLIEFWVDNCFMLEVLTDEMQAEYVSRITIDGWRDMLSTGAPHH